MVQELRSQCLALKGSSGSALRRFKFLVFIPVFSRTTQELVDFSLMPRNRGEVERLKLRSVFDNRRHSIGQIRVTRRSALNAHLSTISVNVFLREVPVEPNVKISGKTNH